MFSHKDLVLAIVNKLGQIPSSKLIVVKAIKDNSVLSTIWQDIPDAVRNSIFYDVQIEVFNKMRK